MTRNLASCCTVGGFLLLAACSSPATDDGTNTTDATGSGGSMGKGGASGGGSGGQGAAGTGGSGKAGSGGGSGAGGSSTGGGSGTGGSGTGGATGGGAGTGAAGTGGSSGSGGTTGGSSGTAGARDGGSTGGTAGTPGTDAGRDASSDVARADTGPDTTSTDAGTSNFSFFVASMKALQTLSGKTDGFGGDLRFGQTDGLAGADEICRQTAEMGLPGAGQKTWRAFLSTAGTGGAAVNARDRIGTGPWYDRNGRLLAANLNDLFAGARPVGDAMLVNDMSNERGEPNHYVGAGGYTPGSAVDNHDTLTGSDAMGMLRATSMADTCNDWTSTTVTGKPYIGHSWPRSSSSGMQWASDHTAPGCVPGLDKTLGGSGTGSCVGCAGGYGGFYCFAVP